MATFTLESLGRVKAGYTLVPEGRYTAELENVEPADSATGPKAIYRFVIDDDSPYKGYKVRGRVTASLELGSINMQWVAILLGRPLKFDELPNWKGLRGKRANYRE